MTTDYATATEAINAMERDSQRRFALEQLYVALKRNVGQEGAEIERGTNSVTWREVLAAMKAVATTDRDGG